MSGLRLRELRALSPFVSQKLIPFIARPNKGDLPILQELLRAGKIQSVIDRCYRLSEAPEAMRYLETGHARGKVVITVGA
jgi:NADPH:quinone reductase-like Zn-dependent oxidoreductase